MKLIIAGSRNIRNINLVVKGLINALNEWGGTVNGITEIVSGGAKGVDILGEEIAKNLGKRIKEFPADWDKHGKSAGYIRNTEMAKYADRLLAVWDGRSRGTKHMIDIMRKEGKDVFIWRV